MLRYWTEQELREASALSVEHFVANRLAEPTRKYEELLRDSVSEIEKLFDLSEDLTRLDGAFFSQNPSLLNAARFLAGPPVSQDDLKTITGVKPPRSSVDEESGDKVAKVILQTIDKMRFPWVRKKRRPTPEERSTAIRWTAGVWAVELIRTWRRGEASKTQEAMVAEILESAGYKRSEIDGSRNILPGEFDRLERGAYTGELKLDGRKCDVPVRLYNGKVFAIECKVSNSEVNSIKRLVREIGGKADAWKNSFGASIKTVAVLSGVFGLTTLVEAQHSHGVFIVWEHDLKPFSDFLSSSK